MCLLYNIYLPMCVNNTYNIELSDDIITHVCTKQKETLLYLLFTNSCSARDCYNTYLATYIIRTSNHCIVIT